MDFKITNRQRPIKTDLITLALISMPDGGTFHLDGNVAQTDWGFLLL